MPLSDKTITDPHTAQQSSCFISTELTRVYIALWLCLFTEIDIKQRTQTSKMKGGGGEIRCDCFTGRNKMSNLEGAAEQTVQQMI